MDFSNNITQIILAIIAIFAVGIAVKVAVNKKMESSNNKFNLKNTKAGGDIVFGNKHTNVRDDEGQQ